ncbi:NAD(P)/FAD-dependent oxidoreductase [Amnibacterium flavum]|uniref:Pyridine nucleotide-disulfide oxidoreductase n=1 Tax=Amnibacterium flavum TaxID=2173173 RepID=A0A2V1HLC3_9MICO|nr:FAD-dependent oxidoreductase [Amnibacterium flavum]PVZ93423.1 pyridine nucleotide-disulfide oxidoreductase [Amnibacterium flavum]
MVAPHADKVRLYGHRRSRDAYAIRDFLTRSVVHFTWIEVDDDAACLRLLGLPLRDARLPVVDLPDGTRLIDPSVEAIAAHLGWIARPRLTEYDLSIYGAGPAGLSAAVYAASEGLDVVLVERETVGGQAGYSSLIENYLGFPAGVAGADLAERARQQAVKFGAELLLMRGGIRGRFEGGRLHADLTDGTRMVSRSNICATGVEWRRLGLEREDDFLGVGLYYGAGTSEAADCTGDDVVVVGGGNSAGQAVMNLSAYARRVTMVVRGSDLSSTLSDYLAQRVLRAPNVEIRLDTRVTRLDGDETLSGVRLENTRTGLAEDLAVGRMFVCIGGEPDTEWATDTPIVRDELGYLVTGPDLRGRVADGVWPLRRDPFFLETSVPGSFAVGDVRHGSVKRVASAVGEGAMAVTFVHRYLSETS